MDQTPREVVALETARSMDERYLAAINLAMKI